MITFRRAVRENVPLVIGLAGPSGSGKTYSAMRLAAGIAQGKPFAVIDTEAGRAKHYAEKFVFDHADLRPPFRPSAYAEAIHEADKAGYPVIVVDSCSHEHAGEGGLIDWHDEELNRIAGQDWKRRESCTMSAWIKPKADHKRFISKLLQLRSHVILCFRAEQKIDMVRKDGKMEIVPKKLASGFSDWIPICEKNMLYELTASFLLTPDAPGMPKPIKLQEQMRSFVAMNAPLDEQAGRKMAAWALGGNEQPADTAAGDGGTARQDNGIGAGMASPVIHPESNDAAAPSFFEQSAAVADWSAVIADTNDLLGLQKHWETITKDARLDSTQKVDLFKVYQKRVKEVGKKK